MARAGKASIEHKKTNSNLNKVMQKENTAGEMVVKVHASPCNHDMLGFVTSSHSESVACLEFRLSNRAKYNKNRGDSSTW